MGKKDTTDEKDKETNSKKYIPIKKSIVGLDVVHPTARPATRRYDID